MFIHNVDRYEYSRGVLVQDSLDVDVSLLDSKGLVHALSLVC